MLRAYFDDSGTHNDSPVVVWGGLLGNGDQWAELESAWRDVLREPYTDFPHIVLPPLRKFGLADCRRGRGDFERYSQGARDAVTRRFRDVIIAADLRGEGYAVDRSAWRNRACEGVKDVFGDDEQMAFGSCLRATLQAAVELGESEVEIWFDLGAKRAELQNLVDVVKANYVAPARIVSIEFVDVASCPPLQAADTIASESFYEAQRVLFGNGVEQDPHFRHLLESIRARGFIVGIEEIDEMNKKFRLGGAAAFEE